MRWAGSPAVKGRNCQKALARPGLPAAVDAVGGGGRDAPRLDGEAGQPAREVEARRSLPGPGRPLRLGREPGP